MQQKSKEHRLLCSSGGLIQKLLIVFLLLISNYVGAQSENDRLSGLEEEVKSLMETYQTLGLSLTIVENGETIFSEGFGFRQLDQKLPVTRETIFPIASVTKPLTASLIGVHIGMGQLSLSDRPVDHLASIRFSEVEMNKLLTIADLLSHRSGIGVVDASHVFFPTGDINRHMERLQYLPPSSGFRERFDYSNMGYAILGQIASAVSGRSWKEDMQKELFVPLLMNRSNCTLEELKADKNYAQGYSIYQKKILPVEFENQNESLASGAINSTSEDLAKWIKVLMNKGQKGPQQIIPRAYLEASFSEQNIISGSFSFDKKYDLIADSYGFGWFVHQYRNDYKISHGGNTSGFTSRVSMLPYRGIGIVILCNQGGANQLLKAIEDIICNRLLGKPRRDWTDYEIDIGEAHLTQEHYRPINESKKPKYDLKEYVGEYHCKGYGSVLVSNQDESLFIKFPAFKMLLDHQEYDRFKNRVIERHHQNTPSFDIIFKASENQKIDKMDIYFGDQASTFVRVK